MERLRDIGKVESLPATPADPDIQDVSGNAADVVSCTLEALDRRGWCLWKCQALGGETIVVTTCPGVFHYPPGYTVWSLEELDKVGKVAVAVLQRVQRFKKVMHIEIDSVEEVKQ
jgi:hypothetical protein